MNHTTRFFNGTRDGNPYQANVTAITNANQSGERTYFNVNVVIFNSRTGEPHYSFERSAFGFNDRGMRAALRAVIANPDDF